MKRSNAKHIARLNRVLRSRLARHLPESFLRTSFVSDLADCYEATHRFVAVIEKLATGQRLSADALESALVEVDVHLLEHLGYHQRSLRKLVPKALRLLEARAPSVRKRKNIS
jgi:hypothetical protein